MTGRKLSPTAPSRLTVDSSLDKDEGISDEEDPAELRVLLDLNEQESSQLRRKVNELEQENKLIKSQLKENREAPKTPTIASKSSITKDKEIAELQKKHGDMEKEIKLLRKSAAKTGTQTIQKLEEEKKKAIQDAKTMNDQIDSFKSEISMCIFFRFIELNRIIYSIKMSENKKKAQQMVLMQILNVFLSFI